MRGGNGCAVWGRGDVVEVVRCGGGDGEGRPKIPNRGEYADGSAKIPLSCAASCRVSFVS